MNRKKKFNVDPLEHNDSQSRSKARDSFQELKSRLHAKLIARVDLTALQNLDPSSLIDQVREITELLIAEENLLLSPESRKQLILEIQNETLGLGPLEQFLADNDISDILVNTHKQIYIEKFGKLELTGTKFHDDNHLMLIIERILSRVGRRVDESSPMVDARLPDGSRVNAIIPPVALDGPSLSIRKFRTDILSMDDLQRGGSVAGPMIQFLKAAVACRLNILISGGTGAGKTTLLNILSGYISSGERIVTIEDSAELRLQKPHVIRLETRPPNIEGKGIVDQRALVRNALRMRPNRIIIGEVRGAEIYDMLQAMNTGHDGSLTTVHANGPRDVLLRLETLMLLSGVAIPIRAIRELISTSIDIVIQINRYSDGSRKVASVSEIVGMEHDTITMQEIFRFNKTGVGEFGETLGNFEATGIRPQSLIRIENSGIHLPPEMFKEMDH
ncbi:MAG: CpaF family protein [candidate division Zixibacteria bacterium]|nr:CpaF family protein [candidate division Zixibacteria bacterium]